MRNGIVFAATAYTIWGLFPLYFKLLKDIPPSEIMIHRMIWSLVFLLVVLAWRKQWSWLVKVVRQPLVLAGFTASAVLLSINWFLYIWAVNNDRVIDASLGYFINPLVSVVLGFMLLGERMRAGQWLAIAMAACGVAWLTWQSGHPPWIGLTLALSFGIYGLLRKIAVLGPLEGLSLENLLLFPIAIGYLAMLTIDGHNSFATGSTSTQWLLAAAGPITAIPLLLFAAGARRIPLSVLGILQYLAPTLQLLLGVLLYNEPFGGDRLLGFAAIWAALLVYSAEGLWRTWATRASKAA